MKKIEFYCVVDPDGKPKLASANLFRGLSIRNFMSRCTFADRSWDQLKRDGFVCKKFTMKEVK